MFNNAEVREELQEINLPSPESLIAHEMPLSPLAFTQSRIHTLDFPILSYMAGIDFFKNKVFQTDSFLSSLDNRIWTNALLHKMRASFPAELSWKKYLQDFSTQSCDGYRSAALINWNEKKWLCKQSLTALNTVSETFREESQDNQDLSIVLPFLLGADEAEPKTTDQVVLLFRMLREVSSNLIKIDLDRIGQLSTQCLTDTSSTGMLCRYHIIALLTERLEIKSAEGFLTAEILSKAMPESYTDQLQVMLNEAKQVNSIMRKSSRPG